MLDSSVFVLVSTSTGSSPETGKSRAKNTGDCTNKSDDVGAVPWMSQSWVVTAGRDHCSD